MVNNMTMLIVNIFEAKAKLSEYLDLAARGERVLICKRNRPIAELHAVGSARTEPRPVGLARGRFTVPETFFAPLPASVLNAFEGVEPMTGQLHAAEDRPSDGFRAPEPRGTRGR